MSREAAARGAQAPESPAPAPAQIAKAALRRLTLARLEPTPENYARAYQAERGAPEAPDADSGEAWAQLIERTLRGLERGSRQWTAARKKESLQRVLAGSRSDARRLQQRLGQLVASWDAEAHDEAAAPAAPGTAAPDAIAPAAAMPAAMATADPAEPSSAAGASPAPAARAADAASAVLAPPGPSEPGPLAHAPAAGPSVASAATAAISASGAAAAPDTSVAADAAAWPRVAAALGATVQAALPADEARGREVALQLAELQHRLAPEGPQALAEEVAAACAEAQRLLQHRHHLLAQLGGLCRELTDGLAELSEDDSWVQGQCVAMRARLFDDDTGLSPRAVRAAGELLHDTRERQHALKRERGAAREALKASIQQMLREIAQLGDHTGRFSESVGRYAETIGRADSLESLAGTVREMVAESRSVHEAVSQAQLRLAAEHDRASAMQARVGELEREIRRLSDEVSTDPLTQVANRRGLMQAFETERAAAERALQDGKPSLAVALIDLDHFKKLNDRLGHANGDAALKFLTQRVKQALRPSDTLARYGGEEFVVLLPATGAEEARQVLTRLQRALSAELFMSDAQGQVFVTFSAGVTPWRPGERIEQALERADEALYEAKRTGRNRTCLA